MITKSVIEKLEACQREIEQAHIEIVQAQTEFDRAQKRRFQRLNLANVELATLASLMKDTVNNSQ